MKLQVGKRYVTRDGEVVGPMFNDGSFRCPLRATGWYNDGRVFRDTETYCDIITEYVEPESRIPQLESRISELESRVAELEGDKPFTIEVGKRYVRRDGCVTGVLVANSGLSTYLFRDPDSGATYSVAGREFIHSENFMDLVSLYVEPVTPVPPSGYSLYRDEPAVISELRCHDSHEPIMHWSSANACWEAGLSRHGGFKFYAIKKGSALSYRCKLETLKLEAGKRYVLEDGRVTMPLCTSNPYSHVFVSGLDGEFVLHYWNNDGSPYSRYCTTSSPISHPFES